MGHEGKMEERHDPSHYDIISDPGKRLAHEGAFLRWLLERAPGKRVLDMACATGVHALFMAENGAEVTARDIKEDSIDFARANRAHPNLTYEIHDLREPRGGPFDLVVVMGNTLSLLETTEDVSRALQAVGGMLSDNGLIFAQVVNYTKLAEEGPRHKVARSEGEGGGKVRIVVKNMIPATGGGAGAFVSFSNFELQDGVWQAWGSQAVLLKVTRDSLVEAFAGAGLAVKHVFGDYDRSEYSPHESPDVIVVAAKPG